MAHSASFGKRSMRTRTFDVWSAVALDGGHTFKIVRISHAMSPDYITERGNFLFGDDLSTVELDNEHLYAVWGDNRAGFQGTWFGRVPLSAYGSVELSAIDRRAGT